MTLSRLGDIVNHDPSPIRGPDPWPDDRPGPAGPSLTRRSASESPGALGLSPAIGLRRRGRRRDDHHDMMPVSRVGITVTPGTACQCQGRPVSLLDFERVSDSGLNISERRPGRARWARVAPACLSPGLGRPRAEGTSVTVTASFKPRFNLSY